MTKAERLGFAQDRLPTALVAIGASAGGLDALERMFDHVPAQSGAAFVVIQHLSPDHKSMMAALLARHTEMPVVAAEDEMELCANQVHLIPPGVIMRVEGNRLRLTPKQPRVLSLPVDEFFHSAAAEWGNKTIGVILSGTGTDGTRGAGSIHEVGGLLAAQDVETARFDGMPASVIATGLVDFVRPVEELGPWLARMLLQDAERRRDVPDAGESDDETEHAEPLEEVLRLLTESSGIPFGDYKLGTVNRRIERRIVVRQCGDLSSYLRLVKSDPAELRALEREMLISVTRFFRDADAFAALVGPMEEIVRGAIERRGPVRLWSAGAATGEEAYSLAILALEACSRLGKWPGVKVFATDVDQASIEAASIGSYPESSAAEIPPDMLDRYFTLRDQRLMVRPELRQCLVFARHNLLSDPPFTQIDMVACRNILIYFKPGAQERALRRLQYSLRPSGFIFLGRSEVGSSLHEDFEQVNVAQKILRMLPYAPRRLIIDRSGPVSELPGTPRERFLRGATSGTSPVELGTAALMQAYSPPPAILLDRNDHIVHSFGDVGQFLAMRSGPPSLEVSRLLADAVVPIAKAVLFRARRGGECVASAAFRQPTDASPDRQIRLVVWPVADRPDLRLLVFEDVSAPAAKTTFTEEVDIGSETRQRLEMLENELTSTRESLRITIEEMEASNEELQATNEEMMASNEELQSSNEELQSVNEELSTVNAEYQEKIDILNRTNADLDNLTQIMPAVTLFVDEDLHVTRFSPDAAKLFKLRPSDIGRPVADVTHRLDYPDLIAVMRQSMVTLQPVERDVRAEGGREFLTRVLPYRLPGRAATAAMLTMIDVSQTRMLRMMQAVLDSLPENVAVLDSSGRIKMVNAAWTRFAIDNGAQDPASVGPGCDYLDACRPRLGQPLDRAALKAAEGVGAVLDGKLDEFTLEYPCDSPTQKRWFRLHARALHGEFGGAVIAHLDISRWKLRRSAGKS